MEYKFEIYKQIEGFVSYDGAEKYDEIFYNFEREIKPVWNDLTFDYKRDNDRYFFRKHLSGEFTLMGDDYDWVSEIRTDVVQLSVYRLLYISEKIDGVWTEVWKGFFSVADGTFDLDRCSAAFSDLLVFDEYSALLENIETEVNLLDVDPIKAVIYEKHAYDYEDDNVTSIVYYGITQCLTPAFPTMLKPQTSEYFPDETEKWTLVGKTSQYAGQQYNGAIWSWIYSIRLDYRRDVQYSSVNPGGNWVDVNDPSGGLDKYARHYKDMDNLSFTETKSSKQIKNQLTGDYCKFWYATYSVILPDDLEVENDRARFFIPSVEYLISKYPIINDFTSLFLQSTFNPVTDDFNNLNYLVLWQISDLKETSDAATKGFFSFKDVETWLKMFQAGWYITEDNVLQVEHRKYFDYGLSYTLDTTNVLDISSSVERIGKSKIKYTDDLPYMEDMEFVYSADEEFIGRPIYCRGALVDRKEQSSTREINFNNLSTDLTYVVSNEDIGNDGFLMASTYLFLGKFYVHKEFGAIDGSRYIWNGYLATSRLHDKYWRWWRSMPTGEMNGRQRSAFTQKNIIIEEDIVVAPCSETREFSPYRLVKTKFGYGKVEEAKIALKDKQLTISVSYPLDAT